MDRYFLISIDKNDTFLWIEFPYYGLNWNTGKMATIQSRFPLDKLSHIYVSLTWKHGKCLKEHGNYQLWRLEKDWGFLFQRIFKLTRVCNSQLKYIPIRIIDMPYEKIDELLSIIEISDTLLS